MEKELSDATLVSVEPNGEKTLAAEESKEIEMIEKYNQMLLERKTKMNNFSSEVFGLEASTGLIAINSHGGKFLIDFFGDKMNIVELLGLKEIINRKIDEVTKK